MKSRKGEEDWVIHVGRERYRRRSGSSPRRFKRADNSQRNYRLRSRTGVYAALSYHEFRQMSSGQTEAHLRYLKRNATGLVLPGHATETGNCTLDSFKLRLKGEKRIYKLILSPSEGASLSPTQLHHLVWLTMCKLAQFSGWDRLGQMLQWCAILHKNSAYPHYHVLIHGLTSDGEETWIRKNIGKNIRDLARASQDTVYGATHVPFFVTRERMAAGKLRFDWQTEQLDTYLQNQAVGRSWELALISAPIARRPALQARMSLLVKAGIYSEIGGAIHYHPLGKAMVDKQLALARKRLKKVPLLFSTESDLQVSSAVGANYEGVITGFGIDEDSSRTWAVFESLKRPAFVVDVEHDKMEPLIKAYCNASLVHLSGNRLKPRRGVPIVRAKKIGASGAIVEFLENLSWKNGELATFPWQEMRVPNNPEKEKTIVLINEDKPVPER